MDHVNFYASTERVLDLNFIREICRFDSAEVKKKRKV